METLIHEAFETLQSQVDALARGTNPVVYFPPGTPRFPELPANAGMVFVKGSTAGAGAYFYNPIFVSKEEILRAVLEGSQWLLLGFVQSKAQAVIGLPILIVARDSRGQEIKSAVVDAKNIRAVLLQKKVFGLQFPGASIALENIQGILLERLRAA